MHFLKHDFMSGYTRWAEHIEDEEGADVEGEAFKEVGYPSDEPSEGGRND